jgi:hypothetical protein
LNAKPDRFPNFPFPSDACDFAEHFDHAEPDLDKALDETCQVFINSFETRPNNFAESPTWNVNKYLWEFYGFSLAH